MENKKKSGKFKKYVLRITIGLVILCVTAFIVQWWRTKNATSILVDTTYRTDNTKGADETPTPEVYNEMVKTVLRRAVDNRDSSNELPTINKELQTLDEKYATTSSVFVNNYLGKYQLEIICSPSKNTSLIDLKASFTEIAKVLLPLSEDFTRMIVNVEGGVVPSSVFYFDKGVELKMVVDLDISIDNTLIPENSVDNRINKDITNFISKAFLNTTAQVITTESDNLNAIKVILDTTTSDSPDADSIDCIDMLFVYTNDLDKPSYIQVYNGESLQFSARVEPKAQKFIDFYTNKPYYQDMSRAEYYICNKWIYGSSKSALVEMLNNLY